MFPLDDAKSAVRGEVNEDSEAGTVVGKRTMGVEVVRLTQCAPPTTFPEWTEQRINCKNACTTPFCLRTRGSRTLSARFARRRINSCL